MFDIAFCGFIGSGKTYMASYFMGQSGGRIESIASPLKKFTQEVLDTLEEGLLENYKKLKKPEHRRLLIKLGHGLRQPDFGFVDFWTSKMNLEKINNKPIYVDDVRYKSESEFLRKKGFIIVRLDVSKEEQARRVIERDGAFDPSVREHPSETSHFEIKPDIIIKVDNKTPDQIFKEINSKINLALKTRVFLYKLWGKLLKR